MLMMTQLMKKSKISTPKAPPKIVGAPQGKTLPPRLTEKKNKPTEVFQHKLYKKEDYPVRPRTAMPDPHPDLDEKIKAKLDLWPYGSNIIVDKKDLVGLQNFFLEIRDIPMPAELISHFEKQHNQIRKILQLLSLEDIQSFTRPGEPYEGPKFYSCKCFKGKR
jgi:hypothetical protein